MANAFHKFIVCAKDMMNHVFMSFMQRHTHPILDEFVMQKLFLSVLASLNTIYKYMLCIHICSNEWKIFKWQQ